MPCERNVALLASPSQRHRELMQRSRNGYSYIKRTNKFFIVFKRRWLLQAIIIGKTEHGLLKVFNNFHVVISISPATEVICPNRGRKLLVHFSSSTVRYNLETHTKKRKTLNTNKVN